MNSIQSILLVITIILITLVFHSRYVEASNMKGFWKADAEFCRSTELELFILYLGSCENVISQSRFGYLLAKNYDGIIINNPVKIYFKNNMEILPYLTDCKKYKVKIDWQDIEHEEDTFPSELDLAYYPCNGKLVFYASDIVYTVLYKDHGLSNINCESTLIPEEAKLSLDSMAGVDI
jgi:hypothetical protein